jgi:hypothetical protein
MTNGALFSSATPEWETSDSFFTTLNLKARKERYSDDQA